MFPLACLASIMGSFHNVRRAEVRNSMRCVRERICECYLVLEPVIALSYRLPLVIKVINLVCPFYRRKWALFDA